MASFGLHVFGPKIRAKRTNTSLNMYQNMYQYIQYIYVSIVVRTCIDMVNIDQY